MQSPTHPSWRAALGDDGDAADDLWRAVGASENAPASASPIDVDAGWASLQAKLSALPSTATTSSAEAKVVRLSPKPARRYLRYVAAAAAAIALLVGVNFLAGLGEDSVNFANSGPVEMPIILPDASAAMLMPGSSLAYAERDGRREVSIAGEVGFEVSPDAEMAFAVDADQLEIIVVGTKFTVNRGGEAGVEVDEGHVRIRGAREADWTDLYAGASARVVDGLVVRQSPDVGRQSDLQFRDSPVTDVVERLSTYYGRRIEVGKAIQNCRVTASFEGLTVDEATRTLATIYGAKVKQNADAIQLTGGACR